MLGAFQHISNVVVYHLSPSLSHTGSTVFWKCMYYSVPNDILFPQRNPIPYVVHYFWPEPYRPWSNVVHYVENRVQFWMHPETDHVYYKSHSVPEQYTISAYYSPLWLWRETHFIVDWVSLENGEMAISNKLYTLVKLLGGGGLTGVWVCVHLFVCVFNICQWNWTVAK